MEGHANKSGTKAAGTRPKTWRSMILPTALTIAIGSIGAMPFHLRDNSWQTVASTRVNLDSKLYHMIDNNGNWVAALGVSPAYFVNFDSPDGKSHFVSLSNETGNSKVLQGVGEIDRKTHSVRYLLVMKDHSRVPIEEKGQPLIVGTTSPDGKTALRFKALSVPREGVRPGFHPGDVEEIQLQIRRKRSG